MREIFHTPRSRTYSFSKMPAAHSAFTPSWPVIENSHQRPFALWPSAETLMSGRRTICVCRPPGLRPCVPSPNVVRK